MSDRAATCVKFNDILKAYVEEIVPLIQESTEELEPEDRAVLANIESYFCGLHSLVHMAESAVSSLVEAEKAHSAKNDEFQSCCCQGN